MPVAHRPGMKQKIIDLHRRRPDLSRAEIARELSCGYRYIEEVARKNGLVMPRDKSRGRKLQDWERQAVLDAYRDGEKLDAVACEFGITLSGVSKIGIRAGCVPRTTGFGAPRRLNREIMQDA